MAKDYLGMIKVKKGDKLDYGVPGMKWGQRRSSAQLRAAAAKRAAEDPSSKSPEKPSGTESSSARYARLAAAAKAGGGSQMDDADLKFFNARTDALSKVNKLNQSDPGWLKSTTKTVLQASAKKAMQEVADAVTGKYITVPITDAIGKAAKDSSDAKKKSDDKD